MSSENPQYINRPQARFVPVFRDPRFSTFAESGMLSVFSAVIKETKSVDGGTKLTFGTESTKLTGSVILDPELSTVLTDDASVIVYSFHNTQMGLDIKVPEQLVETPQPVSISKAA